MREEGCKHCDGLWERYRVSVLEHTRLASQIKLAKLRYEAEIETLESKLQASVKERDEVRRLIVEHEAQAHPNGKPSFSG